MGWCAWCEPDGQGIGRRQLLLLLAQAALVAAAPRRSEGFSIYDESGDVKIGQQADPEILGQFGYYDGADLQNYVAQVGRQIVATSDTRFSFQFKVLDHPMINAMALPGGFVYVTRGMLGELNNEAQLAGILGHETTHVNSRHTAKLLTKAFGAQIATLLGIGAAAAARSGSAATGVAMISGHVTNYLLLGYGREFEQEADEVGLHYAFRSGYDPREMVTFLRLLRRKEVLRGQTLYHGFEATHPDTSTRIAKADTIANMIVTEGSRPEVNADMPISRQPNRELYLTGGGRLEVKADAYKAALDGLRYGEAKERLRLAAYKVKPGDTLASVARDQMQDEGRRFELAGLNGLGDDAPLSPGSVLKIILKR